MRRADSWSRLASNLTRDPIIVGYRDSNVAHPLRKPLAASQAVLVSPLVGALALILCCAVAAEPADEVVSAKERDLVEIERRVEELGTELAGQNAERQSLIAELEERERDIAALALAGRELDQLVREQTRVAAELRERQAQEQEALEAELSLLSDLLRTAYAMGRADRLRMLLNQEDPARGTRVMSYFAYLNRERVRRVDAVRGRAERLAQLARDAEREAARLREFSVRQAETRNRLTAAKQARTEVLASLERTIEDREGDVASLRRDAENLRLLIEHLRQRAQIQAELDISRDPFASHKGRLAWPLLEGRILAGFGSHREGSDLTWDGVLLRAHEGEEVRAVYDGRVVFADWLRGFGLLLVIDHGDTYMSLYGHNETLLKEVGEWVAGGDVIALSGKSGGRDDAALYFGIRHNGKPMDPVGWCRGSADQGKASSGDAVNKERLLAIEIESTERQGNRSDRGGVIRASRWSNLLAVDPG